MTYARRIRKMIKEWVVVVCSGRLGRSSDTIPAPLTSSPVPFDLALAIWHANGRYFTRLEATRARTMWRCWP